MLASHDKNDKAPYRTFRCGCLVGVLLALLFVVAVVHTARSYLYTPGWKCVLTGHQGWVICVAFAPDGQTLATDGADRTVRVWDLSTGKEQLILTGHTDKVVAITFAPNGRLLATASEDGRVGLWNVERPQQRTVFLAHRPAAAIDTPVTALAVAISPDGEVLASGGSDKAVRLWEIASGNCLGVLKHPTEVRSLLITPDGKLLVSRMEDGVIVVWDLAGRREVRRSGSSHMPTGRDCVLLGPDGKTLASNETTEAKVNLWEATTGELKLTLKANLIWQDSPVTAMAFVPDGKILAATTMFGARIVFWDTTSGQLLHTVHFPSHVSGLSFSPDGITLASVHANGTVKLWESVKLVPRQ